MATYLPDGIGVFPQDQGFTPNYQFIMHTLEMRQNKYDQGFSQIKSIQNSILNADLTREDNKDRRDEIIANAKDALKNLPMVDLSNPKNVSAAKSVFKPFYEDDGILWDMTQTKDGKAQIAKGMALQNSTKEEDRNRYWSVGVQDVYDWFDEFKNASAEDAKNMRTRRYVAKPQVSAQILKMFNEGKLKRSIDRISGQIKYTDENGREMIAPLTNLYLSLAENDPEAMEGFNVYGRVMRKRFIKENVANGKYATEDLAAQAHDNSLVNDYVSLQDKGLKESTESLSLLETKIKGWESKLSAGTLTEDEKVKMAQDEIERDGLKKQIEQYNTNKQTAKDKILRNPAGYLGNIYLHKSANDLAVALSSVSATRKIESNPIYKDFVFSKDFEVFKTDQLIRLEKEKSALTMKEDEYKAQLKAIYGDGGDGSSSDGTSGTSGKTPRLGELNVPEVKEDVAASGVSGRAGALPDAYGQNVSSKRDLITKLAETKTSFIFQALDPNEIVDEKGNILDQNQMRSLVSNGKLQDILYQKALKKMDAYHESNPDKYLQLHTLKEQASNLNNAWAAMDNQMNAWAKEIVGNLAATETYPEKTVTKQVSVGAGGQSGGGEYKTVTETVPGKNDGWLYNYLLDPNGKLLGSNDANTFLAGVQKDKNFDLRVKEQLAKNAAQFVKDKMAAGTGLGILRGGFTSAPTLEQAKTQVLTDLKNNFTTYRDKVITKWNERGLNFMTKYAAMPGGGGTTAKVLTFTGSHLVRGEKADVITADLLSKTPGLSGSDDMFVVQGPNTPNADSGDNDPELKKLVNGVLGTEIMNSIKLGKDSDLKGYRITTAMVGGNDPNYHAYTLSFDADFIAKMKGTTDKPGLIGGTADKLVNGITIYINKNKDNTLASRESSMGEIDILVNTSPQGRIEKEVIPGYGLSISKNPISGEYKIKMHYPEITQDNLSGKPVEKEVIVPQGTDLSSMYYQTINDLVRTYEMTQKFKDQVAKNVSADKKITRQDIDDLKASILSNNQ